jgi:hypothetical protein
MTAVIKKYFTFLLDRCIDKNEHVSYRSYDSVHLPPIHKFLETTKKYKIIYPTHESVLNFKFAFRIYHQEKLRFMGIKKW